MPHPAVASRTRSHYVGPPRERYAPGAVANGAFRIAALHSRKSPMIGLKIDRSRTIHPVHHGASTRRSGGLMHPSHPALAIGFFPVDPRRSRIEAHLPMVHRLAHQMARSFPGCVDADDLVSLGTLGLIDAVDRFVPDRSVSFTAFARIRVRGAIVDGMRSADWVPRSVRDRNTRLRLAKATLTKALGRTPTERELAAELGVSETRLRELEEGSVLRVLVSADQPVDDERTVGEALPAQEAGPDERTEGADLHRLVRSVMGKLPERDRMILELHYFREKEFKEIATLLGVTESRISQIHTRIMADLRQVRVLQAAAAAA